MNDALIILAGSVATWLLRASFITIAGERTLPESADGVLRHTRPALLAALAATATVGSAGLGGGIVLLPRFAGALAAGTTAWRTRNLTLTILGGFVALWIVEITIRLAS